MDTCSVTLKFTLNNDFKTAQKTFLLNSSECDKVWKKFSFNFRD